MMGFCMFFAAFGLLVAAQGLGLVHGFPGVESGEFSIGALVVGLSAAGALAAYFLEKRAVRRAREKYGANIRAGYARIHCPVQRTFEADADGFVASCRCGSVRRPWSELTRYSENDRFFLLGTKQDTQVVPKSAFDSPGSVTELRQVVLEKISIDHLPRPPSNSHTPSRTSAAGKPSIFEKAAAGASGCECSLCWRSAFSVSLASGMPENPIRKRQSGAG